MMHSNETRKTALDMLMRAMDDMASEGMSGKERGEIGALTDKDIERYGGDPKAMAVIEEKRVMPVADARQEIMKKLEEVNPRRDEHPVYMEPSRESVLEEAEREGEPKKEKQKLPAMFKDWGKSSG